LSACATEDLFEGLDLLLEKLPNEGIDEDTRKIDEREVQFLFQSNPSCDLEFAMRSGMLYLKNPLIFSQSELGSEMDCRSRSSLLVVAMLSALVNNIFVVT